MKTELKNRILWFDGISEVDADIAHELILLGLEPDQFIVAKPNEDVDLFNSLSEIKIPQSHLGSCSFTHDWIMPQEYRALDLELFSYKKLEEYVSKKHIHDFKKYQDRLQLEIAEIERRQLGNIVRCVIFALDRMKESGSIWGVGRGSSCASLVFFLVGLHAVDPVLYNISHLEFFHD